MSNKWVSFRNNIGDDLFVKLDTIIGVMRRNNDGMTVIIHGEGFSVLNESYAKVKSLIVDSLDVMEEIKLTNAEPPKDTQPEGFGFNKKEGTNV